jgi:hypothetical protein
MPRNMSFMLTTDQMRAQIKDVTRRMGWWFLKPGDLVWAVVKAMGLKKGEKIERICLIRIVSTRREPLNVIDQAELIREGFPAMSPADFVAMFCKHNGCRPDSIVNRIAFEYL